MAKGKIRKIEIDKDVHDQIMIELTKYFKANELWETKGWYHKAIEARNALGAVRILTRMRRQEILDHYKKEKLERKGRKK